MKQNKIRILKLAGTVLLFLFIISPSAQATLTFTGTGITGDGTISLNGSTIGTDGTFNGPLRDYVSVKDYGAKGDVRRVTDGALTSGQSTVTSTQAAWSSADVGKYVSCQGAGPTPSVGGYPNQGLVGKVASVSGSVATLQTVTAGNTISGTSCLIGTDDTAAFQSALNLANTNGQVSIYVPRGNYFVQPTLVFYSNTSMHGDFGAAVLYKIFPNTDANVTGRMGFFNPATATTATTSNVSFTGLVLDGNLLGNDHSPRINVSSDGADVGFEMWGVNNYHIEDDVIKNLYTDGVYNTAINDLNVGTESKHGWIRNCQFDSIGRNGISNSGMIDLHVENNTFNNILQRGPGLPLDVEPHTNLNVQNLFVSGNLSTNTRGAYALQLGAGTSVSSNFQFTNNQWTAMGSGTLATYGAYIGSVSLVYSTDEMFSFAASNSSNLDAISVTSGANQVFITNPYTSNGHTGIHIAGTNVQVRGGHLYNSWLETVQIDATATGAINGTVLDTPSVSGTSYPALQTLAGANYTIERIKVIAMGTGTYSFQTNTNAGARCDNCTLIAGGLGTVNAVAALGNSSLIAGTNVTITNDPTTNNPVINAAIPGGGPSVILKSGAAITGSQTAETQIAAASIAQNTLATGSYLDFVFSGTCTGTNGTKTMRVRFGNTSLSGALMGTVQESAAQQQGWSIRGRVSSTSGGTAQSGTALDVNGTAVTASGPTSATANNTTGATLLELNWVLASALDSCTLQTSEVTLWK